MHRNQFTSLTFDALESDGEYTAKHAERSQWDWVRAAIEFDGSGDAGLSPRSESLLILAAELADDGIVDLADFERVRVVVGPK